MSVYLSPCVCRAGYSVLGLDIDATKADAINQGLSYIQHIDAERVAHAVSTSTSYNSFIHAAEVDALILWPNAIESIPGAVEFIRANEQIAPYRHGQVII